VVDRENKNGICLVVKPETVIANSQPKLGWLNVLEPFDVAVAGLR